MLEELCARWSFTPEEELVGGYCSKVYADVDRVLKIPFQGEEALTGRIASERMSGHLGPVILEADEASGAVLMGRIVPGTKLSDSDLDDEACRGIILGFAAPMERLDTAGLMPVCHFVDATLPLARELLETTTEEVFLHGDLHHENILLGPNGWMPIDPKGLVGDPAFELSAYVRNPIGVLAEIRDLSGYLRKRILQLSEETGYPSRRIWGWSLLALGSEDSTLPWSHIHQALNGLAQAFQAP